MSQKPVKSDLTITDLKLNSARPGQNVVNLKNEDGEDYNYNGQGLEADQLHNLKAKRIRTGNPQKRPPTTASVRHHGVLKLQKMR